MAVPAPPPAQQLPPGVDLSKPGVADKPLAATSSATANQGNSAAKAIDGSLTSRWESAHADDHWIQFDFGTKTQLGYMKLVWENAYGKEYALEVSDDGSTWYQLRYVVGAKDLAGNNFPICHPESVRAELVEALVPSEPALQQGQAQDMAENCCPNLDLRRK